MGLRTIQSQKLHDAVVITLKEFYLKKRNADDVIINPGDDTKAAIKGLYPDVISQTGDLLTVLEVETDETVTEQEALEWKTFNDIIGQFYLVVPEQAEAEAKALIKQNGLTHCKICTYKLVEKRLVFNNLP